MRLVLRLALLICLLWSGWWAVASYGLSQGIEGWLDARRAEGWQADVSEVASAGFPTRIAKTLHDLALADPDTGVAVMLDDLTISTATHWPGYAEVALPQTPIRLAVPGAKSQMQVADGRLSLDLHPGTDLELSRLAAETGAWSLSRDTGVLLQADALQVAMEQGDVAEAYAFRLDAPNAAPGAVLRERLRVPEAWPIAFDQFALAADVTFDLPWDRSAVEAQRPQPRVIKLHLAEAIWGDLRLKLAADLSVDAQGVPEGTANIQAQNWQVMLELAARAGLLPPALKEQAERGLSTLASLNGNPETLDVQINFAGGYMAVGFIPIGPAPRLILR